MLRSSFSSFRQSCVLAGQNQKLRRPEFEGGGGGIAVLPFLAMASRCNGEDRHPSFRDEQSREVTKSRDALETADWTLETMRRRREQMERSYDDSATEHIQRYREARDKALAVLPHLEPVLKR